MFLVSLHSTGGCASGATPVPSGPRHWAHVSFASTSPRSGSIGPPGTHMTNRTVASAGIAIPPERGRRACRPLLSYVPDGKKFCTPRAHEEATCLSRVTPSDCPVATVSSSCWLIRRLAADRPVGVGG